MEKVSVVLSTLNGERYIREQLESLANQSYKNISVYIHDDGSEDLTVALMKDFITNNETGVKFEILEGKKKLGYPECFIRTLLELPRADYYAFCDQDDIWNTDKIERGVKRLNQAKSEGALLYYAAVDYYNEKMEFVRHSKFAASLKKKPEELELQDFLFGGEPLGMTYIFNNPVREALRELFKRGDTTKKDGFIKIFTAATGKVLFDKEPAAKYRRHCGATTGKNNPGSLVKRYIMEGRSLFLDKRCFEETRKIIEIVLNDYASKISQENRELLELFAQTGGIKTRLKKVTWKKSFRQVWIEDLCYRFLFLIGRI